VVVVVVVVMVVVVVVVGGWGRWERGGEEGGREGGLAVTVPPRSEPGPRRTIRPPPFACPDPLLRASPLAAPRTAAPCQHVAARARLRAASEVQDPPADAAAGRVPRLGPRERSAEGLGREFCWDPPHTHHLLAKCLCISTYCNRRVHPRASHKHGAKARGRVAGKNVRQIWIIESSVKLPEQEFQEAWSAKIFGDMCSTFTGFVRQAGVGYYQEKITMRSETFIQMSVPNKKWQDTDNPFFFFQIWHAATRTSYPCTICSSMFDVNSAFSFVRQTFLTLLLFYSPFEGFKSKILLIDLHLKLNRPTMLSPPLAISGTLISLIDTSARLMNQAMFENIKFILTSFHLSGTEDCTTSEITQSCPSPTIGPFLPIWDFMCKHKSSSISFYLVSAGNSFHHI
jgi:hypothetical protein